MREPIEVFAPPAPGSLMRGVTLIKPGRFRLARRDAELYSVQVVGSGSWGRVRIENGAGRELFEQPSSFTGSFVLSAGADGGIVVELAGQRGAPCLAVNWREKDADLV